MAVPGLTTGRARPGHCRILFAAIITLAVLWAGTDRARAAEPAAPASDAQARELRELSNASTGIAVRFRGRELFVVHAPVGNLSVEARAAAIERRLARAMDWSDLSVDALRTEQATDAVDLFIGPEFVVSVTDRDAHPLGRTRRQLAADHAATLRTVIAADLEARSGRALLLSFVWSFVAIAVAAVAIVLVQRGLTRAGRALLQRTRRRARDIRIGDVKIFSVRHSLVIVSRGVGMLRWLLILLIGLVAADFVLMRFPVTQGLARSAEESVRNALAWAGEGVLSFLPNLFYLAIITLGTRYLLAALRFVMNGIAASSTVLPDFPQEWVQPTYQILRFFVLALAVVIAFPFLPGSGSRAFQGVSVFVGVVLSLGSTAAIANMVAGIVLVYMRALGPGDRVRIGETTGDVIACDLLALKLRTIKNVDISIPNVIVLGTHITNYSRQAAEGQLILNTSVTIGYDVPWQRVSELLIAAARATPDIAGDPPPFVLRTALEDFYVRHELNAYTRNAQAMARIYSDLHTNILDRFHEAGVEIMSPHYSALRDGNHVAIPEASLAAGYRPPLFGLLWHRGGRPGAAAAPTS